MTERGASGADTPERTPTDRVERARERRVADHVLTNLGARAVVSVTEQDYGSCRVPAWMLLSVITELQERRARDA